MDQAYTFYMIESIKLTYISTYDKKIVYSGLGTTSKILLCGVGEISGEAYITEVLNEGINIPC